MMKRAVTAVALGCLIRLVIGIQSASAAPQDAVIGVNAAIGSMSAQQQDAIRAELRATQVHYIRTGP
jgi:hypothetical protein